MAAVERLGLAPGDAVQMPRGPRGVYSGSVYPADLAQQRVVHLDPCSGKALLVMACLGIVLPCVSAAVMLCKRRPAGRLQAGVLALLLVGGAAFALVGASMLVMALLDWLASARRAGPTSA